MKKLFAGIAFLLFSLAGTVDAGDDNLPLAKRVSIEKLLLTEKYRSPYRNATNTNEKPPGIPAANRKKIASLKQ